jgi:hypothetical protein
MIGVLAPGSDHRVISEFFELFKTPWEYLQSDRTYDVLLCVGNVHCDTTTAKLVLHYADCRLGIDAEEGIDVGVHNATELISERGHSLVIYGDHLSFRDSGTAAGDRVRTVEQNSYRCIRNGVIIERIGFDLFAQIAYLLTLGQPEEFAQFPTLDLHISLLRTLIVKSGIELLEIPPVPEGFGCIACLTHDIDHPGIKFHKWDATAFGFLYRATIGSLANFLRRRVSLHELVKNWLAAIKLPFVYIGWAEDFWTGFEGRYLKAEEGIRSTYFVVPFGNHPGIDIKGAAPRRRGTGYGAKDIKESLLRIKANGCEVALHGIDAWHDSESGRREFGEIREFAGDGELGVRMHWLFYGENSPRALENAGATYDSTIGYRATVGFRSGTAQAYRPLGAAQLLELPLHIMDTALFYPAYLDLSQREAEALVRNVIAATAEVEGCLTVNWHDRSLAAERNWDSCYRALLEELKMHNPWFATAGEAAAWFRLRRSVVFKADRSDSDSVGVVVTEIPPGSLPCANVRRYKRDQEVTVRG